jgi:hypothetical protein
MRRSHVSSLLAILSASCASGEVTPSAEKCTPGLACTGDDPCHAGTVECDGTAERCVAGSAKPDGTRCGADRVCLAGACTRCIDGATCTSDDGCSTGVRACALGNVCELRFHAADGKPCTGGVCSAGACVACVDGAPCASADGCRTGTLTCARGKSCVLSATAADDTSCSGGTCVAGACLAGCSAGKTCTSADGCRLGVTSCTSGTERCVLANAAADGATCPGGVCAAGTCVACDPSAPCASPDGCQTGTVTCTGAPACALAAVADGMPCAGGVCVSGGCRACVAGAACTSADGCRTGHTTCGTAPECKLDALVPDGAACAGGVCESGACTSCLPGVACTTPDACHTGTVDCSSGAAVCVPVRARADGAGCGTDAVCFHGSCRACAQGASCTVDACHGPGTVDCATGEPVCAGAPFVRDGASCGDGQVCRAGSCRACAQGASCQLDACHTGTLACDTGEGVCTGAPVEAANGAACGSGLACAAGACVTAADVTGTRITDYFWSGGTTSVPGLDVATARVSALSPRSGGGYDVFGGTLAADGSFVIPGVPAGRYLLEVVYPGGRDVFEPGSRTGVDVGWDVSGRPAARATRPTPLVLQASGLATWDAVWDAVALDAPDSGFTQRLGGLPAGATAGDLKLDLLGRVRPAASDTLWVTQLEKATSPTWSVDYQSARRWTTLTGIDAADGTSTTAAAPLAAAPALATVAWGFRGFDTAHASVAHAGPAATVAADQWFVAGMLAGPSRSSTNITLLALSFGAVANAVADFGVYSWGRFLPAASWVESYEQHLVARVSVAAPGATTAYVFYPRAVSRGAVPDHLGSSCYTSCFAGCSATCTQAGKDAATCGAECSGSCTGRCYAPASAFVGFTATLDGRDAFQPRTGVGTSPVLAFDGERAEIVELVNTSGATTTAWIGSLFKLGASVSIEIPPGFLQSGRTYVAYLTRTRMVGGGAPANPYRYEWRDVVTRQQGVTAAFSP